MLARAALLLALASTAACARPVLPPPARLATVACADATDREGALLGRRVALTGDLAVVAGEARGPFLLAGAPRRCPTSPSVLVLGLDRAGAARFAWCIPSLAPVPSIALTSDGFAIASRVLRGATAAAPTDTAAPAMPSAGPEEIALLRFTAAGAPRDRLVIAPGPGAVTAIAALPAGDFIVEGAVARAAETPLLAEHFLVRAGAAGAVDLERRTPTELGAAQTVLVPRRAGGAFRVAADGLSIVVETITDRGERTLRARLSTAGPVVDLAATRAAEDDLWLAASARIGRGAPARWNRLLARVGASGNVNERSLGLDEVDAHVQGVVHLASDRAAVLLQLRKEGGQRLRLGAFDLDPARPIGAAALLALDVPGTGEQLLALLGDDAAALGAADELTFPSPASPSAGAVTFTGLYRGPLRALPAPPSTTPGCGLFLATVGIGESR